MSLRASETPSKPPVWTAAELAGPTANPHADEAKPDKVRRMFAAIAPKYDLNNRLHSFGRDQAWRRFAVRKAALKPGGGDAVLDCACGTGDLTRAFANVKPAPGRVVGLDFTQEMLDIAVTKRHTPADRAIQYLQGDAMNLPFADREFDVVSIAFGIRNVADPAKAVGEFARVLRSGGRLIILEFDRPQNPVIRFFSELYTNKIMPWTATLVSGDRSGAYRYLPTSVRSFMNADALSALLARSGFTSVTKHALSMGVCVCHVATRT